MSSYYEALPIYKAAMDVAARIDAVVQRFGKAHKYTLGGRLREASLDVILLIARSNRRSERERHLPRLCDRIEELKLMLGLGREVKAFASLSQFAEVMNQVVMLARQAIDTNAFPSTPFDYYNWSSSPLAGSSSSAWFVNLYNGSASNGDRSNRHYVRCVR